MKTPPSLSDYKRALPLLDQWLTYQAYIQEIPSLSVGIALGQEFLYSKDFGAAQADTMNRIASHSKLFTTTAILCLQVAGRLQLDDPVSQHLIWFNSETEPELQHLTLRQLLTHSSGLLRDGSNQHWSAPHEFPDLARLIDQVQAGVAITESSVYWKYSNVGFTLRGHVLSRARKTGWREKRAASRERNLSC